MSASVSATVYSWLKEMNIPVSKTFIREQLLSHPNYPSLLSITDTLNELQIENTALHIEKEQLPELPAPFLAHINGKGGTFVMVKDGSNPDQQYPGYFERWSGVVMAAEKPGVWNHKENREWLAKESSKRKAILITLAALAVFILSVAVFSFDGTMIALLLTAAAGVFVSWLIVSKDLGIENKIADQVCGANADCNTVIHSSAGKLPLGVSWSDAGIIYFPFLLLTLLVASFTNTLSIFYPLLVLIAAAAIPVTLVSVYYQWIVIKKWCLLCLVTAALLWLQFVVLLHHSVNLLKYGFDKSAVTNAWPVVFLLFITAATWFWLKPLLKTNKKLETEIFSLRRFKNNPEVFNALLEKQRKLTVNPNGLGIILGNPQAKNTIIKVCNPYCGPCAKAHPVIEELLQENKNLKVQILFTANDDANDKKAKPVKHLMALCEKSDDTLIAKALDDWYLADKKDYEVFANKNRLNGELENQGVKLKAMRQWCDEVKIEYTPTFFINGWQLPKQYKIEDVKYFLQK